MNTNRAKTVLILLFFIFTSPCIAIAGGSHSHKHNSSQSQESSVGKPALASKATRKVKIKTSDNMRFTFPGNLNLKSGETITFIVTNDGKIPHEFSIGDEKEQKSHRLMMRRNPTMIHNDGNTITVKPKETKRLTWKFGGTGTVVFACNIPGHYESGMFKKIKIQAN